MENPRAEEFEHTMFHQREIPARCQSFQVKAPRSHAITCGKPEDEAPAGSK